CGVWRLSPDDRIRCAIPTPAAVFSSHSTTAEASSTITGRPAPPVPTRQRKLAASPRHGFLSSVVALLMLGAPQFRAAPLTGSRTRTCQTSQHALLGGGVARRAHSGSGPSLTCV